MNFRDPIDCYQAIGIALSGAAPKGWRSITAEITLDGERVDAVVSFADAANNVSHLTGVPMLARYFYELARLVSTKEKGFFKKCIFFLNDAGAYDAKFVY
jgi:hypothetical protein